MRQTFREKIYHDTTQKPQSPNSNQLRLELACPARPGGEGTILGHLPMAAMDHLAKNVTAQELDEAIAKYTAEFPRTNVWNGPLKHFPEAIKTGTYPYPEPELKGNPELREALVAAVQTRLPMSYVFAEADAFGAYLILDKDTIIGTGEYQNPARSLDDMSLKDLSGAFENGVIVGGEPLSKENLEEAGLGETSIAYLQFFVKELKLDTRYGTKQPPNSKRPMEPKSQHKLYEYKRNIG